MESVKDKSELSPGDNPVSETDGRHQTDGIQISVFLSRKQPLHCGDKAERCWRQCTSFHTKKLNPSGSSKRSGRMRIPPLL